MIVSNSTPNGRLYYRIAEAGTEGESFDTPLLTESLSLELLATDPSKTYDVTMVSGTATFESVPGVSEIIVSFGRDDD